jgi:hypothetical protein
MLALTPLRPASSHPGDAAAAIDLDLAALGEATSGCGWFDSSWELRQGLAISELPASELAVAALWFPALAVAVPDLAPSAHWQ